MVVTGEARAPIWNFLTAPHGVVFQVPLLDLIAYIFRNLVAKRAWDDKDTISGHEDCPSVEETLGNGIWCDRIRLIRLPLKLFLLVEAIITLDAAFTTTDDSRSLRSLVFNITRNVYPH